MAYSPAKEVSGGSASTPASEMNKKGKNDDKANKKLDPKTGKAVPKGGTYASAKKKDPKLDSYIKTRSNAKPGSAEYNAAQNKINKAYGKGPTNRKTEVKEEKLKAKPITDTKPKQTKEEKAPAPKPKSAMDKAKEAIASGDKKAAKKSGLKGKVKRVAKKAAKEVGKEVALDKAAEATTKKEVRKSGVKGRFKRAAKQDVAAANKQKQKQQIAELKEIKLSPATFKPFDNMDTKNAKSVAEMNEAPMKLDKTPMEMNEAPMKLDKSPINYFKQAIKYDIKEATNPNLTSTARKHYSRNAESDVKSIGKMSGDTMAYKFGAMKGDQSASKIDYANYKGTDKGYKGKTGSSHGDQSSTRRDYAGKKGGSILSKHMKS